MNELWENSTMNGIKNRTSREFRTSIQTYADFFWGELTSTTIIGFKRVSLVGKDPVFERLLTAAIQAKHENFIKPEER